MLVFIIPLSLLQPVRSVAVLPDGRLASGSADKSVFIWDLTTGSCVRVLQGHTNVSITTLSYSYSGDNLTYSLHTFSLFSRLQFYRTGAS